MSKKYRRLFFCVLCLLLCLSGVSEAAALRISGWRLPFNVPVMVEREKKFYDAAFADYDVSILDLQSGPRLMTALVTGDVDIVQGIGDAAFLVAVAGGLDAHVVAVNSRSPKVFAVVSNNPAVRSVADLKGRRVAGLRGSVVHQVFVDALREAGLAPSDVEFFPMPVAQAASTLLAGRVDAALLVGSEIVRAQAGGARVIADGEGRVRGLSLVVASSKFIRENPDAVARFRELRAKTLDYMASHPDETTAIVSLRTRQEPEAVRRMMAWYDFNFELDEADRRSFETTKKYLLDNDMIRTDIDLSRIFMEE